VFIAAIAVQKGPRWFATVCVISPLALLAQVGLLTSVRRDPQEWSGQDWLNNLTFLITMLTLMNHRLPTEDVLSGLGMLDLHGADNALPLLLRVHTFKHRRMRAVGFCSAFIYAEDCERHSLLEQVRENIPQIQPDHLGLLLQVEFADDAAAPPNVSSEPNARCGCMTTVCSKIVQTVACISTAQHSSYCDEPLW
jgi:hypothetical protein